MLISPLIDRGTMALINRPAIKIGMSDGARLLHALASLSSHCPVPSDRSFSSDFQTSLLYQIPELPLYQLFIPLLS